MRSLALILALCACRATATAPTLASTTARPLLATADVAAVTPVVAEAPPEAAPATPPPFGLTFARSCEGYLRPLAVSPAATRLLACDQVFDDDGRYRATPRRPVAALLDDGGLLVLARDGLARTGPDERPIARVALPTNGQEDRVALGRDARTALWLRASGPELVELDVETMRSLRRVSAPEGVRAIAYARDGTPLLAARTSDHPSLARWEGARLVDIPLPEGARDVALADLGAVAFAIGERGRFTAISVPDGATRREHTLAPGDEPTIPTPDAPLVSPSPDGERAVVCDARGLTLHRLDGSAAPARIHDRCEGPPRFSADGRSIVTSEFGVTLLRAGAPPRARARREAMRYELPSLPEGFVPWVRVDDRGTEVLSPEGSAANDVSHIIPDGFVRAWHHTEAGADLWVSLHDDTALRLDQPLASWALAALAVYGGVHVDARDIVAWRTAEGARAVEATWRTGGCDPSDVIFRAQEHLGGVAVARLDAWSSRQVRHGWWAAMVAPVLGAPPRDATRVTAPTAGGR